MEANDRDHAEKRVPDCVEAAVGNQRTHDTLVPFRV